MNFSQIIEQLKVQYDKLNLPPLTSSQFNQLTIGIGTVVLLYVMFKLWQWRRRRAQAAANAPKMRPRQRPQTPATPAPPVTVVQSTAASTSGPAPSESVSPTEKTTIFEGDESTARRGYAASNYWPVEPKSVVKKNLFEDVGEEYPWADGSDYAFGAATPVLSELLPTTEEGRRALTKSLRNAGYYTPHAWQNLSAVRYLGIVLPIILFGALLIVVPESLEAYMIAGMVVGPAIGWALPTLYIRGKAANRLREIENAMPDMLDLLNMCVSQGMTVPASLRRVGQDIAPVYPALAKELNIVADQARVGHLTEALSNFSERVDTPDVHSFSSLMIQTEQMGTSVSEALNDYSDSMREAQKQRADEKANAATFKLLFPTVLCLMPAVFLFLMGPALIELNRFFAGGGLEGLDRGASQAIERQR
ncbi:type II secretion system F family protein [Planctomicrobium sp. SH661]|uniref:type II secretion system F family protein n=1 Tax=Planctomicrobium sp. SH661 TaxID=3448124 RepID=UPI003F5C7073